MRISDWSSDVCSSDLDAASRLAQAVGETPVFDIGRRRWGMVEIVGNRLQRRRSDQGDGWMRGAYLGPKRRIELVPHQPDRAIAQKGSVAHEVDGIGRIAVADHDIVDLCRTDPIRHFSIGRIRGMRSEENTS